MTYPKSAYEAFEKGQTYRPRTWGVGARACQPREDGVEVWGDLVIRDGVEIEDHRELILFHYVPAHYGAGIPCGTRKYAIARKPIPESGVADPFFTRYEWVESRKGGI